MRKRDFSLKNVLLEIVIVIIGISIAFWLNNWGEIRKENIIKKIYLESFREELQNDKEVFEFQIESNERNLENISAFLTMLNNKQYEHDSIDHFVGTFLKRNNWNVKNNTFEILKGSGKLEIISNFDLRKKLSFFYELRSTQTAQITSSISDFLENQFYSYLSKNTDFYIQGRMNNDFVKQPEFQSLLKRWQDKVGYKLFIYRAIVADIGEELLPKLEAELESL